MGYDFTIGAEHAVRVKAEGRYPWPTQNGTEKGRTIELDRDDVLTKDDKTGTYMVHTGLGCFGIVLTDDQVEPWGRDLKLRLA